MCRHSHCCPNALQFSLQLGQRAPIVTKAHVRMHVCSHRHDKLNLTILNYLLRLVLVLFDQCHRRSVSATSRNAARLFYQFINELPSLNPLPTPHSMPPSWMLFPFAVTSASAVHPADLPSPDGRGLARPPGPLGPGTAPQRGVRLVHGVSVTFHHRPAPRFSHCQQWPARRFRQSLAPRARSVAPSSDTV